MAELLQLSKENLRKEAVKKRSIERSGKDYSTCWSMARQKQFGSL
jgi:hypothetical protein